MSEEEEEKATVVLLTNTNSSPLWELEPRELSETEEEAPDDYFAYIGPKYGAVLVILLAEDEGPTGLLAFDENGLPVDIPALGEGMKLHDTDYPEGFHLETMDGLQLAEFAYAWKKVGGDTEDIGYCVGCADKDSKYLPIAIRDTLRNRKLYKENFG